jgi:D-arabinose 1-dehydrogenase-like Zn-dependent alcohol dehydrogenase
MHWKRGPAKKVGMIGLGGIDQIGVKIAHALGGLVQIMCVSITLK